MAGGGWSSWSWHGVVVWCVSEREGARAQGKVEERSALFSCRHTLSLSFSSFNRTTRTPHPTTTHTMFEARLTQGILLKKVVDAVKDLVNEVNLECSATGFGMQAMDQSHVSLVNFNVSDVGVWRVCVEGRAREGGVHAGGGDGAMGMRASGGLRCALPRPLPA